MESTARFANRSLEFRIADGEVCVCGTAEGLAALQRLIGQLIETGKEDHIHLEDYELLTEESLSAVIALLKASPKK